MAAVSIIVPIYNAMEYIEKCAHSLFKQNFSDIEYIFVNDCSSDSSMNILKSTIEQYQHIIKIIKIIEHNENKGSGAARATGLKHATAEYVIQIDADDWCQINMISMLYEKAKKTNADIVVCDYYLDFFDYRNSVSFSIPENKFDLMNAFAVKPDYMNYFWNKLVKRSLFTQFDIQVSEKISMCDDLLVMFKLMFFAEKIEQCKQPLYFYNKANTQSITSRQTIKNYNDRKYVTDHLIAFLKQNNQEDTYKGLINFYKLYTKLMLIVHKELRDSELWQSSYTEANEFIWTVPLRLDYKLMSWLSSLKLDKIAYLLQDIKQLMKFEK